MPPSLTLVLRLQMMVAPPVLLVPVGKVSVEISVHGAVASVLQFIFSSSSQSALATTRPHSLWSAVNVFAHGCSRSNFLMGSDYITDNDFTVLMRNTGISHTTTHLYHGPLFDTTSGSRFTVKKKKKTKQWFVDSAFTLVMNHWALHITLALME